ncbi:MAG: dihydrolipoyl dehydrogenase, partial [Candidatus Eisenbacteria bacterium]|nr:dihydrolipoyl dehydrogenase [Candidatus Eisenbacteria bacterium]
MASNETWDVVVIGGGPGGYTAGIWAARLGMKAAVVEATHLGGVCLNWGCIPTKALLRNGEVLDLVRRSKEWGLKIPSYEVEWPSVVRRSRRIADRLSKGVAFLFKKNGVAHFPGRGRLLSASEVEVTGADGATERLQTRAVIVATGARPRMLPGISADGERIVTSKEAMVLKEVPGRFLVIGAGAIGVEFAQIYGDFGSEVTLVELLPRILPVEDEEVSAELRKIFAKRGWKIHTEAKVTDLERDGEEVVCRVEAGGAAHEIRADAALVAVGVQGNLEDLGLEELGVETAKGFISTGPHMETNVAGVYAIGDVAGPPWLAHVAAHEGMAAVSHLAGKNPPPVDHALAPGCTYCRPQVASLGLTEQAARERGLEVKIGRFPFRANGRSLAQGETDGFVKLVFGAKHGELLGAHLVGPEVTELLAELGLAATSEVTHHEILGTMHA